MHTMALNKVLNNIPFVAHTTALKIALNTSLMVHTTATCGAYYYLKYLILIQKKTRKKTTLLAYYCTM